MAISKATEKSLRIELPPAKRLTVNMTLVGETPLIVNRWSEKAKKAILDKQMNKVKDQDPKDPEQMYLDSLHTLVPREDGGDPERGPWGFPVIGFKAAAVTAVSQVPGMTKVLARQTFNVTGCPENPDLVQIMGDPPIMREDMVRIGMGKADIRYRGEFRNWWTVIPVTFNAAAISTEQIFNLFNIAGFGVGVGEWRPEKDGMNGLFHVADEQEMENLEAA